MNRLPLAGCLLMASAAHSVAAEVTATPDLAYADADPEKNKFDLYMPKGAKGCPVVLFVHGGGYRRGDRKEVKDLGPALASRGAEKLATDPAKAFRDAKGDAETLLVKDRTHRSMLEWIGGAEPGGKAILAFVRKHSGG